MALYLRKNQAFQSSSCSSPKFYRSIIANYRIDVFLLYRTCQQLKPFCIFFFRFFYCSFYLVTMEGGEVPISQGNPDSVGGNTPVVFSQIVVHEPEVRSARFSSYHTYKITSTPSVVDHVYRRYTDFVWLSESLHTLFPGIFVPPIPPKKTFGAADEKYISGLRRPGLERFLNRIISTPILVESIPFQMFICRAHTFEDGQKEIKKLISDRNVQATLAAFQHYYPSVITHPLPTTVDQDVQGLNEFLKQEETRLTELVDHSTTLSQTVSQSISTLNVIGMSFQNLYNAEKGYPNLPNPSRHDGVLENFTQWHVDLKESEDAFTSNLVRHFTHELDDTKVFLELVHLRESLRTKYEKTKAKSLKWADPSAKCDSDKLRTQRELEIRAEEEESSVLDAVTKLILFSEFNKTWSERMVEFKTNMIQFAQSQGTYAQRGYQNWSPLASTNPEE